MIWVDRGGQKYTKHNKLLLLIAFSKSRRNCQERPRDATNEAKRDSWDLTLAYLRSPLPTISDTSK